MTGMNEEAVVVGSRWRNSRSTREFVVQKVVIRGGRRIALVQRVGGRQSRSWETAAYIVALCTPIRVGEEATEDQKLIAELDWLLEEVEGLEATVENEMGPSADPDVSSRRARAVVEAVKARLAGLASETSDVVESGAKEATDEGAAMSDPQPNPELAPAVVLARNGEPGCTGCGAALDAAGRAVDYRDALCGTYPDSVHRLDR